MSSAKPKITLHIYLDTNALFTEAADRLLSIDISEFITKSFANDLATHWYLPSVVIGERRFQMIERANRLLPHLEKVEKLLGHHLGITEEVLSARVDDAIKRQMEMHKLIEKGFDQAQVDWHGMVQKSISRMPPFDSGENEKGFRDAIVLETFCQLVADLPKTQQVCRIILLSNDERLITSARERNSDRANITFANDLEAVKTILNALASEITQETVNALLPRAGGLFFESGDKKTLYYTADVYAKIRAQHAKDVDKIPPGSSKVIVKAINITSPPTFLIKERQKLTLSSRIIFRMEAIRYVQRPQPDQNILFPGVSGIGVTPGLLNVTSGVGSTILGSTTSSAFPGSGGLLGIPAPATYDEVKREGEHVFEAKWTTTLTSKGKLTRPKLLAVDLKTTNWKET